MNLNGAYLDANHCELIPEYPRKVLVAIRRQGKEPAEIETSPEQKFVWQSLAITVRIVDRAPDSTYVSTSEKVSLGEDKMCGVPIRTNLHLKEDRILFKDGQGEIVGLIVNLAKPRGL